MASKNTKMDLEISLSGLQLPLKGIKRTTRHVLTAKLLWPRVSIAQKSSEQTITLRGGILDIDNLPWCQRMFFKESVEGHFGLCLEMTIPLTQAECEKIARYTAGKLLHLGANTVDDFAGIGDLVAIPIEYSSQQLLKNKDTRLCARGYYDLEVEDVPDNEPMFIQVPLLSLGSASSGQKKTKTAANQSQKQEKISPETGYGLPVGVAEIKLMRL